MLFFLPNACGEGASAGTLLRSYPSHSVCGLRRLRWAPPVHEATGGYAVRNPFPIRLMFGKKM